MRIKTCYHTDRTRAQRAKADVVQRERYELVAIHMTSKNVGGRPAKGEGKRTYRLTVHLSDDERTRLASDAQAAGLSVATLVRLRALGIREGGQNAMMAP